MDRMYELMGIGSPEEFRYFENMAELMEHEEQFTGEEVCGFLRDLDKARFSEILSQYFDHIQELIPDRETDFYTLVENIHSVMENTLNQLELDLDASEEEEKLMDLADEIVRFRNWFLFTDNVVCTNEATDETDLAPVVHALACAGAEKLGEDPYTFDFNRAMDYELDRLTVMF